MFSVIIPLYNKELSVSDTIKAVLAQSYSNFEIVIVNDGSTDNSLKIVSDIGDSRIRIIDKINGGVSSARNTGINEAKNEWIAFLDADDLWTQDHLETICNMIMRFPEDNVFCTSYVRSNEKLQIQQSDTVSIIENYFEEAIKYPFFWTSVTAINRKVFSEIGVFNESFSRGEDLDLWARIGMKYRFIRSHKVTAIYVQESDNKLSLTKTSLDKSILSNISFSGLNGIQTSYYRALIIRKVKSSLRKGDICTVIKLVLKYNFKLI